MVRALAERWAHRERLCKEQIDELGFLLQMALGCYMPRSSLSGRLPIDQGSFGNIFRCKHQGRDVAVKEIGQDSGSQSTLKSNMRDLFLELRVLVLIRADKHPSLVEFIGCAVDFPESSSAKPSIGLVFELCARGSLESMLFGAGRGAKGVLDPRQKVNIAADVAGGLAYLHSRRIMHRDLNTSNVLVDDRFRGKISDFGCAVTPSTPSAEGARRVYICMYVRAYRRRLCDPDSYVHACIMHYTCMPALCIIHTCR